MPVSKFSNFCKVQKSIRVGVLSTYSSMLIREVLIINIDVITMIYVFRKNGITWNSVFM